MKLLTKAIEKALPALYSQEKVADPLVRLHYFNPTGAGDWYIIEGQHEDGGAPCTTDDYLMFGLCDILEPELGYVSLAELASYRGPLGLGIERDLNWTTKPLSEVKEARGYGS